MAPIWVPVAFGYLGGLAAFALALYGIDRYRLSQEGKHAGLEDMTTAYSASVIGGLLGFALASAGVIA